MANTVTKLLVLGTELSKQLLGAEELQKAEKVVIDLSKSKPYCTKLRSIFCPKANAPRLEVRQNMDGEARGIAFRFIDGNAPLSGAELNYGNNGRINFNLNVVDSGTKSQKMSVSGHYNPNEPFFDRNNCGETLEHRSGNTIASVDSSGFAIRVSVNDTSALNAVKQIKAFFG